MKNLSIIVFLCGCLSSVLSFAMQHQDGDIFPQDGELYKMINGQPRKLNKWELADLNAKAEEERFTPNLGPGPIVWQDERGDKYEWSAAGVVTLAVNAIRDLKTGWRLDSPYDLAYLQSEAGWARLVKIFKDIEERSVWPFDITGQSPKPGTYWLSRIADFVKR